MPRPLDHRIDLLLGLAPPVAVWFALCWPLLSRPDLTLAANGVNYLSGGMAAAAMSSEALRGGQSIEVLVSAHHGLGAPLLRGDLGLPPALDLLPMAMAQLALPFPRSWSVGIAIWVLIAVLASSSLVRTLGARWPGAALAGVLTAASAPLWRDVAWGRFNSASMYLAVLWAAGALWLLQRERAAHRTRPRPRSADLRLVAGGLVGAVLIHQLFAIYPPWLLLAAGLTFGLLPGAVGRPGVRGSLVLLVWAIAGVVGAVTGMERVLAVASDLGSDRAVAAAARAYCPLPSDVVPLRGLATWGAAPALALSTATLPLALYVGAPLVLARRDRRIVGALGLVLAAAGAWLALGPCTVDGVPRTAEWTHAAWRRIGSIHDHGRLLAVSGLLLAVCAALGVDHLVRHPRRGLRAIGVLAGGAVGLACVVPQVSVLSSDKAWRAAPRSPSAEWLASRPAGAVAELPFDDQHLMLSIAAAPGFPRVNPIVPPTERPDGTMDYGDALRPKEPAVRWLWDLGTTLRSTQAPDSAALDAHDLRYVIVDQRRCRSLPSAEHRAACPDAIVAELQAVLGPPTTTTKRLTAWER